MSDDSYQSPWRKTPAPATTGMRGGVFRPERSKPPAYTYSHLQRHNPEPATTARDFFEGLLQGRKAVVSLPRDDADLDDIRITDCRFIGSYNWLESKENKETPTILVPGSPPHWLNRSPPYTIPPDKGSHLGDQNGFKMPKAVLLPLIVAVNKCQTLSKQPAFDWKAIDIITDRNNLRKLTRWVEGDTSDFRIDIQLAGDKTLLMSRWSEKYWHPFTGRTYGISFEKASTDFAPGCNGSTGHHRIVSYDLNGLKLVVRFEVDACIRPPVQPPRTGTHTSEDALTQSLSKINLSLSSNPPGSGEYPIDYPLLVREGGCEVPAASIIELTTRSEWTLSKRGYDWKEAYPQLFFSQTANHFLAVHNNGKFSRVEKKKLRELADAERDAQRALKKVRALLEGIRDLVRKEWKDVRVSLVVKDGVMGVYERNGSESILPEVALAFFKDRSDGIGATREEI